MFWADKIASKFQGEQVVNDSKTPSGRVHVGSLRGVIVHDTIYRALKRAGKPVRFTYGIDDFDALDTVPKYLDRETFAPYLGAPLCNVPSPGSGATDYAKFYSQEFFEVFDYLGVKPEIYYLRDLYRQGKFNEHIDTFLNNAHLVREAYKEISGGERSETWYPFQPICENCGKIATTEVTDYNGKEVFYTCKPEATDYTNGCGHSGWMSPFDGNGKLPWKVEWVAKWQIVGVTIELAGKDHSQKGGSRDVANAICRKTYQKQPPFHAPYEFILVNGTKMSSSKGVGSSAKEIADLLPPELLRFLMLRTPPRTAINFAPNYETTTRLFRDYDTAIEKYRQLLAESPDPELSKDLLPLLYAQTGETIETYQPFDFSTLISLLQVPHIDIQAEIAKRTDVELTAADWETIATRITAAQHWLDNYADTDEKLVLYLDEMPEQVSQIDAAGSQYLNALADNLAALDTWEGEALQTAIFTTTKELEIPPTSAFPAIYYAFLGKERGPKAGNLLSYLDRDFTIARLRAAAQA
jgi:lysyl-tRNA synthetase class 1